MIRLPCSRSLVEPAGRLVQIRACTEIPNSSENRAQPWNWLVSKRFWPSPCSSVRRYEVRIGGRCSCNRAVPRVAAEAFFWRRAIGTVQEPFAHPSGWMDRLGIANAGQQNPSPTGRTACKVVTSNIPQLTISAIFLYEKYCDTPSGASILQSTPIFTISYTQAS
jgi:hypothetical protein